MVGNIALTRVVCQLNLANSSSQGHACLYIGITFHIKPLPRASKMMLITKLCNAWKDVLDKKKKEAMQETLTDYVRAQINLPLLIWH